MRSQSLAVLVNEESDVETERCKVVQVGVTYIYFYNIVPIFKQYPWTLPPLLHILLQFCCEQVGGKRLGLTLSAQTQNRKHTLEVNSQL